MSDAEHPNRRSIRLGGYDYSTRGHYFITLCAHQRAAIFGEVIGGEVLLSATGMILAEGWRLLARHTNVRPDAWIVMPNHFHGIIELTTNSSNQGQAGFGQPIGGSLATIVGELKSRTARLINQMHGIPGQPVWQRNYYERIIRDERELNNVRRYIEQNPLRWNKRE